MSTNTIGNFICTFSWHLKLKKKKTKQANKTKQQQKRKHRRTQSTVLTKLILKELYTATIESLFFLGYVGHSPLKKNISCHYSQSVPLPSKI